MNLKSNATVRKNKSSTAWIHLKVQTVSRAVMPVFWLVSCAKIMAAA